MPLFYLCHLCQNAWHEPSAFAPSRAAARQESDADLGLDFDVGPGHCLIFYERLKAMSDTLPDRLSVNPNSPYYDAALLERGIGILFKGVEKTNVEEYCVSESWVRLTVGNTVDRKGNPMTVKLQGPVEPYFRSPE